MKVGLGKFAEFLKTATLAGNYTSQLVSYYQTIAFVPNLVGAFGDILSTFYTFLGVTESTAILLLFSHLVLVVLAGVGLGVLQASLNRAFLAILGEAILSWAVVSGSLLFLTLIVLVYGSFQTALIPIMAAVILIYLGVILHYVVGSSSRTYAEGAMHAGSK
jgi:hypothetical protein